MAAPQSIVSTWLNRIGLDYAIPVFASSGITQPQQLMTVTNEDFDRLGVVDEGAPRAPRPRPPRRARSLTAGPSATPPQPTASACLSSSFACAT